VHTSSLDAVVLGARTGADVDCCWLRILSASKLAEDTLSQQQSTFTAVLCQLAAYWVPGLS
jgi:hypothetical protein